MNELALFAGVGGGILGGKLLGWRTICAVERDAYAAQVLAQRQNDGILEPFPIWSDVCSFDGKPWRGLVDVVSGGFPCQDISAAGKGVGIDGERSGLWTEIARIVGEVRPHFAFMENSPLLVGRGLTRVLGDLAVLGYDAVWDIVGADDVGAPHVRKRIWILAKRRDILSHSELYGIGRGKQQPKSLEKETGGVSYSKGARRHRNRMPGRKDEAFAGASDIRSYVSDSVRIGCGQMELENGRRETSEWATSAPRECALDEGKSSWWEAEPDVGRVADGVAARVDKIRAIGNGQVPLVAATAFNLLMERF